MNKKTTFALFFANRSFMPGETILEARKEMVKAVNDAGYGYIIMDEDATRFGGVETREEGKKYAAWLKDHEGEFDGVILSMPIFADENGAMMAMRDAGVPILLQAYPDEIGKMDFAHRRDAFCGKFSVSDVFTQADIPFTVLKPHVVHPLTKAFKENLDDFAAICRVVNGMKRFNLGILGARTTAFKTVRFDEVAFQKHGINSESFDFSELVDKVNKLQDNDPKLIEMTKNLEAYADFKAAGPEKEKVLAKIATVIQGYIDEYDLQAFAIRCWNEMEQILRVCPCVLLSYFNDHGISASCEIDVCSAITMRALSLASGKPASCLDWNNNYGDDEDKVVLFHCGSTAKGLMKEERPVSCQLMFEKTDPGSGCGCLEGRIAAFPTTISNCNTNAGKITIYFSEGEMTDDPIEHAYFGVAGVAKIPDLQNKLIKLARLGFKHHTTITPGHFKEVLTEAFTTYLHYDVRDID